MEKLKEHFNEMRLKLIGEAIQRAHPPFPADLFCNRLKNPIRKLELKGRIGLIARELAEHLPREYEAALAILLKSIQTETNPGGLRGFQAWPLTQFVENNGLDDPQASMAALKEITKVMSAEFAIRPFLLRYPKETLRVMEEWAGDANVHVRRLVSEGTRPRLPWASRLPAFQKDPALCIGLLRKLRLDPELYVRKSVANHLNDFSKDHPQWLVAELTRWKKEFPDSPEIRWIIRHALRSMLKQGHQGALALMGYRQPSLASPKLRISPSRIKLGSAIELNFSAKGKSKERWMIDYAIYHRKKNGELKPKVFKWALKEAQPGQMFTLKKMHRITPISTRNYYPGRQEVEILVNGKSVAREAFFLRMK